MSRCSLRRCRLGENSICHSRVRRCRGLSPNDLRMIGVTTLEFGRGKSDLHHPRDTTHEVHALLPNSKLVDPPWADREWFKRMLECDKGLFRLWPQIAS
jgi:hypothetical protein